MIGLRGIARLRAHIKYCMSFFIHSAKIEDRKSLEDLSASGEKTYCSFIKYATATL